MWKLRIADWSLTRVTQGGVAISEFLARRFGHSMSLLPDGRNMLMFGGTCEAAACMDSLASLYQFDTITNEWSIRPTTLDPASTFSEAEVVRRSYHTTELVDGKLYVIGGCQTSAPYTGVMILDTTRWEWSVPDSGYQWNDLCHAPSALVGYKIVTYCMYRPRSIPALWFRCNIRLVCCVIVVRH